MSIVLEAVAGAALSAFFDVLIDKLSSSDLLNIFRQENVDADLKKWKTILLKISEVLDDAEEKQITKASVKTWMGELEDLAYDADDILDEFATEALRRKVNAEKPSTSKVRKFIPACCLGLNPSSIMFDANMRSKIKEINTKLQEIVTRKNDLKLEDSAKGRTRTVTSRVPATSLVESHTYGREEDKKAIVELLTGGSGGAQFSTISILGMGGLGKTTLAKLVYNDSELRGYFDVAAWSCVSQDFDTLRVTKEILQDITSKTCNDNDLNLVQRELKKQLSGKKFLLILDDVWIENYSDWTKLRLPFESGAPGSKILITTRHANVSSTMGDTNPYKLGELSNDACLTMFTQHALGTSDFGEHLNDEERQKILDRCKGLPLAAKALAGLLRTYDRDEWKDVLNGRIWDLLEKKTDVPSTLRLSYLYLPSSLKKCFAYCSLFPKGYNFKEKKLVLLWMAEGLVRETEGEKPMEDLGGEYFRDLLKRSFFQQLSINESRFVMHDLMHDLAQWAAGDLCCRLEDPLGGSKISPKVRHISYIDHSINCIKKFDDLPEDMHLRTFLLLTSRFLGKLTNSDAILPQLRSLRVLSLDRYDICELPSSIGDLKHLRYLNLSYTKITILPESTSSLYNLQTLILKGCDSLTKLPENIENLVNLRHLNISNANSISKMPVGIAKLKSLRTLCFEDMDEWQDWIPCTVECCEEFPCLRELSISNCPKLRIFSYHLPSLKKVSIDACEQLVVSIPSHSVIQVLKIVKCKKVVLGDLKVEKLIIPSHSVIQVFKIVKCMRVVLGYLKVEKLIIENCTILFEDELMSLVTPEIEINSCLGLVNIKLKPTLRTLTIKYCSYLNSLEYVMDEGGASSTSSLLMNEENLSCIGNNSASLLEHLEIYRCSSLKSVSTIVDLAAMLERLDIKDCPNLTSLSSKEILPTTLKVLSVWDCPKLEKIVDELHKDTLLEDLVIQDCEMLKRLPRGLHELCHLKKIYLQERDSLISNCPSLKCISFPEEGFHTNLRELGVAGANLCKQIFEFGLHKLTSLRSLFIARGIMDSLPEEEDGKTMLMLPTSLTSLTFYKFPNLEFLSWKFFQNLSALEQIDIDTCPKLASLSEKCFPPSLQRFHIYNCPVLKQNCEKDKGIMWSKIANIPSVMI
ncbi:putative disease resistance RPP13-like protein 1 isoform X4 [Quercus robur]|uniref:putative disease resistance RPP13-like protein 1 isoform X4 n=1 Tax=Quercus robur TaxID=38942 RepID=UPI00216366B2|nr:putative disease resistance RPP13-like protein 1 isoform X4 [Quercus robur]